MEQATENSAKKPAITPFTQEEFLKICIETKTGHDVISFDKTGKYATPEQVDQVFQQNFTRSRQLTVLHNLNFTTEQSSEITKKKMMEQIPTFHPKENKASQNAKNLAQNIEKGARGMQID